MEKIGIIGAGKVGVSMGMYIQEKTDFRISGYLSKSLSSSEYASVKTDSQIFTSLEDVVKSSDVIIITTPDDVIPTVWEKLKDLNIQNKIICHCSGSLSSEIFFGITAAKAGGASVHPMLAISSRDKSYKKLSDAFFTVEGDKKAVDFFERLFSYTKNKYKIISRDAKARYHIASVFMSNFVVALSNISVNLLKDCGFSEREALDALKTLAVENLSGIMENGTVSFLTGPVERCDVKTVSKHLENLDSREMRLLYSLLSMENAGIAELKNEERDYSKLKEILKKEI